MTPKAQVYAKYTGVAISPKKVIPVAEMIRGKFLEEAKIILAFHQTKVGEVLLKTLVSAEANAVSNSKLNKAKLYVADAQISSGPVAKRGRIVARSRLNPILKRTSHILIGLSEKGNE